MINKPRDALVFAALIMVPAYLVADQMGDATSTAERAEADATSELAGPPASATRTVAAATMPADDIDIDDWFAESAVQEELAETEPVADQPLPDPDDATGFDADVRKAVASLDRRGR